MDSARPSNRLASETSEYLRQHMHNPVDWWPWGEEALARANAEEKPLLVSIGYSACHWCHVMERESFEDPETAAIMNEHFVSIKVDREERPDVDQIYMDTLMRLQGHGGWPLTVFCKSNGEPYYAGTYFPPEPRHGLPSFQKILLGMARAWNEQREQVDDNAGRILEALREQPNGVASGTAAGALLANAANELLENADKQHGGFGAAPKFPTPANLELLLAAEPYLPEQKVDEILGFLRLTCEEMARRGLYDQLGGGFHRYCVDDHWGIPHFEKMLYDQGQLARIYADVWRRTGERDPDLVWPVQETALWLRREMTGPEGGWFASQDADSEGEEGKFYVWSPADLDDVLGRERGAAFAVGYSVSEAGNFEGKNALWDRARGPRAEFAAERAVLLEARSKRVPPGTDRKRVAAWNGYTISGLAYAGSIFEEPDLVDNAAQCADFVLTQMRDDRGRLLRVFAEGQAKLPAFLDDMAGMLAACLDLFRAGAGHRFLGQAIGLAEDLVAHFFDPEEADLFLSPEDGDRLPHRPRSDHDGATPNSTGLAVLGLLRTAELTGREDLRRPVEAVLERHAFVLEKAPTANPTLLRAAAWAETGLSVALVVGQPDAEATLQMAIRARRELAPEEAVVVVAGPEDEIQGLHPSLLADRPAVADQATAYVCRGHVCTLPITDPAEFAFSLPRESPGTNG